VQTSTNSQYLRNLKRPNTNTIPPQSNQSRSVIEAETMFIQQAPYQAQGQGDQIGNQSATLSHLATSLTAQGQYPGRNNTPHYLGSKTKNTDSQKNIVLHDGQRQITINSSLLNTYTP